MAIKTITTIIAWLVFFPVTVHCDEVRAPRISKDSDAYRSAQKIADRYHSEEFQKRLKKESKRLAPRFEAQKKALTRKFNKNSTNEDRRHDILIFISGSMPADKIMAFVKSAYRLKQIANATVLIQGVPKTGLTPFLNDIGANDYPIHFSINPLAFKTHQINNVPAVVINEEYGVRHPFNLRAALSKIADETETDLADLIYALNIE